jgi:thioredoxin-like negative regulator of GroEL
MKNEKEVVIISTTDKYKSIIKREMSKLQKHAKLRAFTSAKVNQDGSKIKECYDCGEFMNLLRIYEENSNGMLEIEELSISDHPEFSQKYDIQRVPTILFIDEKGRELVRYLAAPKGQEIQPFVKAIFAFAGGPNYYENTIKQNLNRIEPSTIKIMMTMQCPYCPQLIEIANQFAIASEGKIRTVIIDIIANPDIGQYYNASGVPYTIINERPAIQGMIGAPQLLKELIGSNINIQYR